MAQHTTIQISKEYLHFAAAHFTIFNASEREHLHGHNFHVTLDAHAPIGDDGLTFDYNILKRNLKRLCDALDEQVLLPTNSPHLTIETEGEYTLARFADEKIPFLPRDVTLLPVRNITVEELSHYLLQQLTEQDEIAQLAIDSLVLRVSSGDGQWAEARLSTNSSGTQSGGGDS